MTTTTRKIAEKALQIADQNPDYIYEKPFSPGSATCFYLDPHEPSKGSCLFGQALLAEGVDARAISTWEGVGIESVLVHLAAEGVVEDDDPDRWIRRAVTRAQYVQDSGRTWGEAAMALREGLRVLS